MLTPPVQEAVEAVRTAMEHRDLFTAGTLLDEAWSRHRYEPGASRELTRLRILYRMLLAFWAAVRDGARDLTPEVSLEISGREAWVKTVDAGRALLVYADGSEVEMTLTSTQVDADLAVALAARQLKKFGPVAGRMVTAFWLCDRERDVAAANSQCEVLYAAGLDVDIFLPELKSGPPEAH